MPSKGLSDVVSQPLSSNAVSFKDHGTPCCLLISHQNAENLLAEDLSESSPLPDPPLPRGVSHGGPNEDEEGSIYEHPQLLCAKSSPGTELSQQAPSMDFPVAEKTVTQVILKEEGGTGLVHTMTVTDSMVAHTVKRSNVRSLGEEMYNAQMQVEALAHAFSQCLADQDKAQVITSSDMMQLSACQVDRSDSEASFSGAEEPQWREATNVTSSCPLVQRMLQIDFPLPGEE
ncbi:uncharacterized protein LOC125441449 [Sphaerodactylus townsendi]|uniref:uncharacterized protein LOC125441449 n=1 Tax=Sphaerodactylus townsendi TaxID=933632 RepID=UPI00202718AB|nr:uncharacterized protein LOC125441449 [Sphaerodactylus townsendi]